MGTTERREREREALRMAIMEAARDILSDKGLDGLSMRAIARRIEYSPATIYLHFEDKDDLIRSVVQQGFRQLADCTREEVEAVGPNAPPVDYYRATGRAYVRFAVENTAYFRVMFEIPGVANMECAECDDEEPSFAEEVSFEYVIDLMRGAVDDGTYRIAHAEVERAAIVGWGAVHGLVSLYVSGHLGDCADTPEEFEELIERAMDVLGTAWRAGPKNWAEGAPLPASA